VLFKNHEPVSDEYESIFPVEFNIAKRKYNVFNMESIFSPYYHHWVFNAHHSEYQFFALTDMGTLEIPEGYEVMRKMFNKTGDKLCLSLSPYGSASHKRIKEGFIILLIW